MSSHSLRNYRQKTEGGQAKRKEKRKEKRVNNGKKTMALPPSAYSRRAIEIVPSTHARQRS
jgi:hypothetical protein